MHALTGYLDFRPEDRETTMAAIRAVIRAEPTRPRLRRLLVGRGSRPGVPVPLLRVLGVRGGLRPHQAQPYEHAFMTDHVSRIVGADANVMTISDRTLGHRRLVRCAG